MIELNCILLHCRVGAFIIDQGDGVAGLDRAVQCAGNLGFVQYLFVFSGA